MRGKSFPNTNPFHLVRVPNLQSRVGLVFWALLSRRRLLMVLMDRRARLAQPAR
jgi:hypothetical protein